MSDKILLISLQNDVEIIGLKQLHYSLMKNGYDSHLLFLPEFTDKDGYQSKRFVWIRDFVNVFKPMLIGISLMSGEYYKAINLARLLKYYFEDIPIICGGIHPTISPESCIDYFDYVCIGEGDQTIIDFVKNIKNPEVVNNLAYKENNVMVRNELNPLLADLDSLPFYDFIPFKSLIQRKDGRIDKIDKKSFKKYSRFNGAHYSVVASRGCPFSCTYCCNNFLSRLYSSKSVRRRSIGSIIKELERFCDSDNIKLVSFQDDCFLSNRLQDISEFSSLYRKRVGKPFSMHAAPVYVTDEKIATLSYSGLSWINLGLQTGSDGFNRDIYHRRSYSSDFLRAAKIAEKYGVATFCDVIVDNPIESEDCKLETINVLMNTPKPFFPQMFSLNLYEGTELYNRIGKSGDFCSKDYALYEKNKINKIIRLACFLPEKYMKLLIKVRDKRGFSLFLNFSHLLSSVVFEPISYFRLIRRANKGSYLKTISNISDLVKRGLYSYMMQFRKVSNEK